MNDVLVCGGAEKAVECLVAVGLCVAVDFLSVVGWLVLVFAGCGLSGLGLYFCLRG